MAASVSFQGYADEDNRWSFVAFTATPSAASFSAAAAARSSA